MPRVPRNADQSRASDKGLVWFDPGMFCLMVSARPRKVVA